MGKKSPKQPEQPDPYKTAESQLQTNVGTALAQSRLNMVDQVTPFGTVRYEEIMPSGQTRQGQGEVMPPASSSAPSGFQLPAQFAGQKLLTSSGTSIDLGKLFGGMTPSQSTTSSGGTGNGYFGSAGREIPRFRQIMELDPNESLALGQQREIRNRTNDIVGANVLPALRKFTGEQFAFSGLPKMREGFAFDNLPSVNRQGIQMDVGANDFSTDRGRVEEALYNRQKRYLDPMYQQQERALETKLANQGIMVGNDAYSRATTDFTRNRDTAYMDATDRAILAGGEEQSRLFGMDVTQGQFRNTAQGQDFDQQFNLRNQASGEQLSEAQLDAALAEAARKQYGNEQLMQRQQQGSELQSFMGLGGGFNMPQMPGTPQSGIAAPDLAGAIANNYNGQLNNYNQQLGARNAGIGAVGGLAGSLGAAAIMSSDSRLKENIVLVDNVEGLNVYEFNYTGNPARYRGLMADEVLEVIPEAIHTDERGYMMVDYSKTPIMMEAL